MAQQRLTGSVVDFDFEVGLGHVLGDDGAERMFHCVEIADGSRKIAVGTRVSYVPVVRFGLDEACDLRVVA